MHVFLNTRRGGNGSRQKSLPDRVFGLNQSRHSDPPCPALSLSGPHSLPSTSHPLPLAAAPSQAARLVHTRPLSLESERMTDLLVSVADVGTPSLAKLLHCGLEFALSIILVMLKCVTETFILLLNDL